LPRGFLVIVAGEPGTGKSRDTRAIVSLLALMARGTGKPVLLTHHLRKRTSADRNGRITPERLHGSSVISQIARVIWTIDVPNPAEPRRPASPNPP
jgi:hypothetical protein